MTRSELLGELRSRGVLLNSYAETLINHAVFDLRQREEVGIVERNVGDLGFSTGATLPQVFARAHEHGLEPCPADTGPYLRLMMTWQANAPDSVLSAGRSPTGALKVACAPVSDDVAFPRGFYLRVVDGQQWLRGFRCDDEYLFSPEDRFAFRVPEMRQ
ncbi:hypothetical protein [Humibacter albus]|uniref:hypothetical protein n=1 Tax=Humibacter albus TaxID=427754 RepID=UPI0003FB47AE|nr:hypothetical protein [Humibacter albus]